MKVLPRLYEADKYCPIFNVDLNSDPWSCLLPDKIPPFGVEEFCRPNNVYSDGILPGSTPSGNNCISTKINVFTNYLEWSKVTLDDVVILNNDQSESDSSDLSDETIGSLRKVRFSPNTVDNDKKAYHVTSRFFESRNKGWSQSEFTPKQGKVIGYIFNGIAYHIQDTYLVEDIVYSIVYKSLIEKSQLITQLRELSQAGTIINVTYPSSLGVVIKVIVELIHGDLN
jgi:hypothetical protein